MHGYKWQQIASVLPGRSANAVRNRFLRCSPGNAATAASGGERQRRWYPLSHCSQKTSEPSSSDVHVPHISHTLQFWQRHVACASAPIVSIGAETKASALTTPAGAATSLRR